MKRAAPRAKPPRDARVERIEETTRLVARALRHAIDRGGFSLDAAVDIALVQMRRPGGPAKRIPASAHAELRAGVEKLARALDPAQPRSILAFSRSCSEASWSLVKDFRHPGAGIAEASSGSARQLAEAAVWAEASRARNDEDHVRRAVTRALRERKKGRGLTRIHLDDGDPLRAVLDVPERGKVLLPRTDVRARIASAAEGTPLGEVLRQAARFSEDLLHPALGEEIWSIGRPVGFADKAETRVVVEVRSTMAAHEMQLRSQELAHRLRKVKGFEQVQGVKIAVVEPRALKVTGRPRRTDA